MSYFHWKYNQLSSALRCFTVLFGMGRSGTTTLWSPDKMNFFDEIAFRELKTPLPTLGNGVLNFKARQCPTFTGNTTNYHRR